MRTVYARGGAVLLTCLTSSVVLLPTLYIYNNWHNDDVTNKAIKLQCAEPGGCGSTSSFGSSSSHLRTTVPTQELYQVNDQDIYIYAAYFDDRWSTAMIRFIGMQSTKIKDKIYCRFYYEGGKMDSPVDATFPVYEKWPSLDLQLHAYFYQCKVPSTPNGGLLLAQSVTLLVQGSMVETPVPVHGAPKPGASVEFSKSGEASAPATLAVCVKALWGRLEPHRLVEWIEMNRLLGVEKIIVYDGTITGPAVRVLKYYVEKDVVEIIPYKFLLHIMSITKDDKIKVPLLDETMYMEQTFLVSMNDCLYRNRKRFRYIAIMDTDELIVPKEDELLLQTIQRALVEFKHAAGFGFNTAWHLTEFGAYTPKPMQQSVPADRIPPYLHMQRHLRRTPVMKSQPKTVFLTDRFITVNWHSVVMMPSNKQLTGNEFLDHERYGELHHYRARCKYDKTRCDKVRKHILVDTKTARYLERVKPRVLAALQDLLLI